MHHVALLCENLERSLDFYCGVLGLEVCVWAGGRAAPRAAQLAGRTKGTAAQIDHTESKQH